MKSFFIIIFILFFSFNSFGQNQKILKIYTNKETTENKNYSAYDSLNNNVKLIETSYTNMYENIGGIEDILPVGEYKIPVLFKGCNIQLLKNRMNINITQNTIVKLEVFLKKYEIKFYVNNKLMDNCLDLNNKTILLRLSVFD